MLCLGTTAMAQQIQKYEYWLDQGHAVRTVWTGGTNELDFDVDVSDVNHGLHTLNFRAQDSKGKWSAPSTTYFFCLANGPASHGVSLYEYWLDKDITAKTVTNNSSSSVAVDVDVTKLSLGLHTLSFRCKDEYGNWSAPQTNLFFIPGYQKDSDVKNTYEYWIDDRTSEKVQVSGYPKAVNLSLDVNSLITGLHSISFRASDKNGRWTSPQTSYFLVTTGKKGKQDIKAYRYWFNNAVDNSVTETTSPAVIPFTLDTKLTASDIVTDITPETITMTDDGEGHMKLATKNVLHTQYCTTDGRWTAVTADTFAVVVNAKEVDLTGFIKNPMASDKWNGWKTEGNTIGVQNTKAWEEGSNYFRLGNTSRSEWTSSMEQTIMGLPAGTYILSAKGRATADVAMEISANEFADVFPATGTEGGELGNGWNERSIIFTTDGLPFVIKVSGSAKATGKWMDVSDFRLTYSNASNASLTVSMPEKTDMRQYKNLKLQLTSVSSKLSVTTSDSKEYTFQGLAAGVAYDLTLTNRYGQIVAKKESIFINEGENNAILPELATLCNAEAAVLGSDNTNLTNKSRITWMLADNSVISEDSNVTGLLSDTKLMCNVSLGDSLGCVYHEVTGQECQLKAGSNTVKISLVPIEKATVTGKILTNDGNASLRANVSITALLSGKYAKTHAVRTDTKGAFTTDCHQDSLHIVVSADGYLDCVIDTVCRTSELDLGTLRMKEITGIVITPRLNYTRAVEDDAVNTLLYTDSENVDYTVKNLATNSILDDVAVQSGNVIVKNGAAVGQRLAITVHSRKDEFADVTVEAVIADDETANAVFELTEKGGIKATYEFSGNTDNVAMLYDENGSLVSRQFYNGSKCSFSHLADGHYSLLTMGKTLMLDAILNLADVSAIGLTEGVDYVLSTADVKAGKITVVNNDVIPAIDETLFYYTGTNTSFTANKNSVVVGNYITLTGRLDFKEEYAADVDNLSLVVDLPEGMEYVKGSAIIGTTLAPCSVDGNRLTISLNRNNYQERIRFCVVPTKGGSMMPSAFVAFSLDKDVMQPIGSASITAKDMSISVPATSAKTEISVSGVAVPYSKVTVYDGTTSIGQITAKADGNWLVKGDLVEPYNLSTHPIYAHVVTPQDIDMNTESVNVLYDKNAIEVKTVTMLNTAHTAANLNLYEYRTVFDFQNPSQETPVYWYWPSYPDFTFLVDLTNNDTTVVSDVYINVKTSNEKQKILKAEYNAQQDKWVAKDKFYSGSLPTNVSVSISSNTYVEEDSLFYANLYNDIKVIIEEEEKEADDFNTALQTIFVTLKKGDFKKAKDDLENLRKKNNNTQKRDENLYQQLSSAGSAQEITHIVELHNENIVNEVKSKTGLNVSDVFDGRMESYKNEVALNGNPVKDDASIALEITVPKGKETSFSESVKQIKDYKITNSADNLPDGSVSFVNGEGGIITIDYSHMCSPYVDLGILSHQGLLDVLSVPQKMLEWGNNNMWPYAGDMLNLGFTLLDEGLGQQAAALEEALTDEVLRILSTYDGYSIDYSKANFEKYEELINARAKNVSQAHASKIGSRVLGGIATGVGTYGDLKRIYGGDADWENFIGDLYTHCGFAAAQELEAAARKYQEDYRKNSQKLFWGNAGLAVAGAVGAGFTGLTLGASLTIVAASAAGTYAMNNWANGIESENRANYNGLLKRASALGCSEFPPNEWTDYPGNGTDHVMDPSGYVYEAVSSNRLEGVTATIYQKVTTEDMYGDKHDNIVKWDAEPYSQKNPVKTDINGLYAWDVPNGLWQVKFEKEGYETVYSDWLPVPPPQLDINVPMYQSVQPEIISARGFESGVDFTFSKYMRPGTFEDGCVTVSRDGKQITGHLTMLDVEKEPLDGIEYASHVKFVPEQSLHVGDKVTLTVSNKVKSYCGVAMAKDYTTTLVIQPEIKEIVVNPVVNIVYGSKAEIAVSVLPADAAKGKKLMVQNGTPSIINIEGNELMLDANGSAIIPVTGTLPGNGALRLSVENSDAAAEIAVTVVVPSNEISVPEASIPSGATVGKGSVVVLSCLTDGATIYYTLDGSCPCDEATRLVYTEPIVINETVTIKAMAVASDMTESDIVEFTYIVEEGDGIDDVTIDENLKIYPLPVRDKLNITAGGKVVKSVTLVSTSGSTVVSASKPATHVTIDVSNLTSGIYIINVWTEDKTYSRKIMKVE